MPDDDQDEIQRLRDLLTLVVDEGRCLYRSPRSDPLEDIECVDGGGPRRDWCIFCRVRRYLKEK